jgi:hypothetical protein
MAIVTQCTAHGCETLTIGRLCVEHDLPVDRVFVRGRPFARRPAPVELRLTTTGAAFVPTLRTGSERAVAARSPR